jgi:hypothetical protein
MAVPVASAVTPSGARVSAGKRPAVLVTVNGCTFSTTRFDEGRIQDSGKR